MSKKISVIVPVYNVEAYLDHCVRSILNQTYDNLEIILVNDGSSDKSGDICDKLSMIDNRISVIHKKNGGLSEARNSGLESASGDYISFIDSDDFIHEMFYEELVNIMQVHNADIAQCEYLEVDEKENYESIKKGLLRSPQIKILSKIDSLNNLYSENYVNSVIVCNKLYSKHLFDKIRFPKGKIHEDQFTMYKVLFACERLVHVSVPMYYYLQRSSSITGQKLSEKNFDLLEAYSNQILFYEKHNLVELQSKAINSLENAVRSLMFRTIESNDYSKTVLFDSLIDYYKSQIKFFKLSKNQSSKNVALFYLINYSPSFFVKSLFKLRNHQVKMKKTGTASRSL